MADGALASGAAHIKNDWMPWTIVQIISAVFGARIHHPSAVSRNIITAKPSIKPRVAGVS